MKAKATETILATESTEDTEILKFFKEDLQ